VRTWISLTLSLLIFFHFSIKKVPKIYFFVFLKKKGGSFRRKEINWDSWKKVRVRSFSLQMLYLNLRATSLISLGCRSVVACLLDLASISCRFPKSIRCWHFRTLTRAIALERPSCVKRTDRNFSEVADPLMQTALKIPS